MGVLGPKSHNFGTDLLFLVCGFKVIFINWSKRKSRKFWILGILDPIFEKGVLGPKSHNFGHRQFFVFVCSWSNVTSYKQMKMNISTIWNSGDFRPNFRKWGSLGPIATILVTDKYFWYVSSIWLKHPVYISCLPSYMAACIMHMSTFLLYCLHTACLYVCLHA